MDKHITIIVELKNSFSDISDEIKIEMPIPKFVNIEFILPPPSAEYTKR